ncbi:hypothetical protein [Devosia sp. CN2-171]|jgi:hypothetical protein|uniref:hypothetical protein n=1 Tax=Devosia sp. CN2-171 TaxID=3400909 RepID=UPI003BF812DD
MNVHTLIEHHDIQKWVTNQHGQPALARFADTTGRMHAKLAINFAHHRARPTATPSQDDGMAPCSWTAWLAELDRQNLALRIRDDDGYEFVDRRQLN